MKGWAAPIYLLRGLALLRRNRALWPWTALAFGINLLVYTIAVVALAVWFGDLIALAPDWAGVAGEIVLGVLIGAAAVAAALFTYTLVGNAVAGPVLDVLAEKILASLGEPPPKPRPWHLALVVPLVRQVQKLLLFGAIHMFALLLWLIPGVGAAAYVAVSVALLVYFLGLEYLEYPLDLRGLGVGARFRYSLRHLPATMGYGAAVAAFHLVPLLGYLSLPAAVAGAALLVHDLGPKDRS